MKRHTGTPAAASAPRSSSRSRRLASPPAPTPPGARLGSASWAGDTTQPVRAGRLLALRATAAFWG